MSLRGGRAPGSELSAVCVLIDKAVFSPTNTTAAIPTLAHMSQRTYQEDSGSTHICFRSQAICCKCVRGAPVSVHPSVCVCVCGKGLGSRVK